MTGHDSNAGSLNRESEFLITPTPRCYFRLMIDWIKITKHSTSI